MKFVEAFLAIFFATQAYLPQLDGKIITYLPRLEGDIVGGHEVDIADFPYQVSVRLYDRHICGGSIINGKSILTAASCVGGAANNNFIVKVGDSAHISGKPYKVLRFIQHCQFNPKTFDNDIAILKLVKRIIYSSTVQPIRLQSMGIEVPDNTTAWVSGWGSTDEDMQDTPALLRAVEVRVISFEKCSALYNGKITTHMLCANSRTNGVCHGDVGSPLVSNGKLIGIVSWGHGCARPQFPGVYVKVSALYDWVITNAN